MRESFLERLACPDCAGALAVAAVERRDGAAIVDGSLACTACAQRFPVRARIPRFVPDSGYADNFGWQWNRFQKLQRDSYNGTHLVRDTILRRSQFTPEFLAGKSVLECGCGSGNDTEVLAEMVGTLVSIDMSVAVDAQSPATLARENVLVLQADLRRPPLRPASFDIGYCHRVIQHTPDPPRAFAQMAPFVAPGGVFFLHSYDTHWKSTRHFKYWVRPLIRKWPHERVFRWLSRLGPLLYPTVGALNRIAFLRRPVKFLIPFENHDRIPSKAGSTLTRRERYEYSLLITFDDLTPEHDHPHPPETLCRWFEEQGYVDIEIRGRRPSIVVGRRPRVGESADSRNVTSGRR
ncbi:MAG: methyltransferase domain-containing protein [Planctomycetes bacterium]|nr:methyltransferase domain-containing protein [Planctomycetota bacterium]